MLPAPWADLPDAFDRVGGGSSRSARVLAGRAGPDRAPSGEAPSQPHADATHDLRRLFADWVDSESKLMVMRFFRDNPGVVETLEGLAARLGVSPRALEPDLADHVRLGLLRVMRVGDREVYLYDRRGAAALGEQVDRLLDRAKGADA